MVTDLAHVGFTAEIPLPNQGFPAWFLVAAEVLGGVGNPVVAIRPYSDVDGLFIEDVRPVTGAVHPSGYDFLGRGPNAARHLAGIAHGATWSRPDSCAGAVDKACDASVLYVERRRRSSGRLCGGNSEHLVLVVKTGAPPVGVTVVAVGQRGPTCSLARLPRGSRGRSVMFRRPWNLHGMRRRRRGVERVPVGVAGAGAVPQLREALVMR